MDELRSSWITDGLVDFEYKKYVLLAYLKKVKRHFSGTRLYPHLGDLVIHYNNLITLKENKDALLHQFPKSLNGIDLEKLKFNYRQIVQDDEIMEEIQSLVNYATPQMKSVIDEGKEIYEFVEEQMEISPVGLVPVYDLEGYFFLGCDPHREVRVYRYQLTIFHNATDRYQALNTTFISAEPRSLINPVEQIKLQLIKRYQDLPNPATYNIHSKFNFPVSETMLPIAKRLLVKELQAA